MGTTASITLDEVRRWLHSPPPGEGTPLKVVDVRVDEKPDASGNDSVFVTFTLDDSTREEQLTLDAVSPLERKLRQVMGEAGERRFIYFEYQWARDVAGGSGSFGADE